MPLSPSHITILSQLAVHLHSRMGGGVAHVTTLALPTAGASSSGTLESPYKIESPGRKLTAKQLRGLLFRVPDDFKADPAVVLWTWYDDKTDTSYAGVCPWPAEVAQEAA